MPTLFSLLGLGYDSRFYGRDVLSDDYEPRAFIATYQDLGYLEDDIFTVLSPVERFEQFRLAPTAANPSTCSRSTPRTIGCSTGP